MKPVRIVRVSSFFLEIAGAVCCCGGILSVRDWHTRNEWRYELYCEDCGTCDPGGYETLGEVAEAARNFDGVPGAN